MLFKRPTASRTDEYITRIAYLENERDELRRVIQRKHQEMMKQNNGYEIDRAMFGQSQEKKKLKTCLKKKETEEKEDDSKPIVPVTDTPPIVDENSDDKNEPYDIGKSEQKTDLQEDELSELERTDSIMTIKPPDEEKKDDNTKIDRCSKEDKEKNAKTVEIRENKKSISKKLVEVGKEDVQSIKSTKLGADEEKNEKKDHEKKDYEKKDYEKRDYEKKDHEKKDHEKKDHEKKDYEKKDHEKTDHEKKEVQMRCDSSSYQICSGMESDDYRNNRKKSFSRANSFDSILNLCKDLTYQYNESNECRSGSMSTESSVGSVLNRVREMMFRVPERKRCLNENSFRNNDRTMHKRNSRERSRESQVYKKRKEQCFMMRQKNVNCFIKEKQKAKNNSIYHSIVGTSRQSDPSVNCVQKQIIDTIVSKAVKDSVSKAMDRYVKDDIQKHINNCIGEATQRLMDSQSPKIRSSSTSNDSVDYRNSDLQFKQVNNVYKTELDVIKKTPGLRHIEMSQLASKLN